MYIESISLIYMQTYLKLQNIYRLYYEYLECVSISFGPLCITTQLQFTHKLYMNNKIAIRILVQKRQDVKDTEGDEGGGVGLSNYIINIRLLSIISQHLNLLATFHVKYFAYPYNAQVHLVVKITRCFTQQQNRAEVFQNVLQILLDKDVYITVAWCFKLFSRSGVALHLLMWIYTLYYCSYIIFIILNIYQILCVGVESYVKRQI